MYLSIPKTAFGCISQKLFLGGYRTQRLLLGTVPYVKCNVPVIKACESTESIYPNYNSDA